MAYPCSRCRPNLTYLSGRAYRPRTSPQALTDGTVNVSVAGNASESGRFCDKSGEANGSNAEATTTENAATGAAQGAHVAPEKAGFILTKLINFVVSGSLKSSKPPKAGIWYKIGTKYFLRRSRFFRV